MKKFDYLRTRHPRCHRLFCAQHRRYRPRYTRGYGAMPAPTAAKAPTVKEPVQKIDKSAGKVTASQGVLSNSKINASRSGLASSDGHAHEHTDAKHKIHTK